MNGPTLVFDGDCAFCTSSAELLRRWAGHGLVIVPWQRAPLAELGLTGEQCRASVQFVGPDGSMSGGAAIACALDCCRMPWRTLAPLLRIAPGLTERGYAWVARHRHRLPGGTAACAADGTQSARW